MKKLLFILLLLTPVFAFAQTKTASEDSLRTFINSFALTYSNLGASGDVESVLKHMDKSVSSTILGYDIGGKIRTLHSDYNGFERHLKRILYLKGLSIDYKISDIIVTYVRSNVGALIYTVKYKTARNGETWIKGTETVALTVTRQPKEDWKITHYTVIAVEDEKLKGSCKCELFEDKETGNYASKTIIPSGEEYTVMFDEFKFQDGGQGVKFIEIGESIYKWRNSGVLSYYKNAFAKKETKITERKIGSAKTKVAAILQILQREKYPENCTKLKLNRNRKKTKK
jgi:hypothetical protein